MLCSTRSAAAHDESIGKQTSGSTFLALTLTVTSRHSQMLGPACVKIFNSAGGSIGRGAGNDWVLPDPSKFVSTRHAMIEYTDGNFYLCDTSTNGTFVNGSAEPVVYGSKVLLKHGDRIQ